jgi:hypothetical protein
VAAPPDPSSPDVVYEQMRWLQANPLDEGGREVRDALDTRQRE